MAATDNSNLLAVERQRIIRELLQREGAVRSVQLQELLNVSLMTVRADLRELEKAGECKLVWGGAVSSAPLPEPRDRLEQRSRFNSEAKARIGLQAAEFIEPGQTIIVDSGSTTLELINHIPPTLDSLRIFTPSLNIAIATARCPQFEVIVPGGTLRNLTLSLVGPQTIDGLELVNADLTFLSASAFSLDHGITTSDAQDVYVKKAMIRQGQRVILLADSSKFGRVNPMNIGALSDIDLLITDDALADGDAKAIRAQGVEVIRA